MVPFAITRIARLLVAQHNLEVSQHAAHALLQVLQVWQAQ